MDKGREDSGIRKGWKERRCRRIARFRLANEMKGDIGKKKRKGSVR